MVCVSLRVCEVWSYKWMGGEGMWMCEEDGCIWIFVDDLREFVAMRSSRCDVGWET